MSVLLRPSVDAADVPVLALAAGAAMAEACRAVTALDVRCKWPNDLVIRDRKLGGILCEAAVQGGRTVHVAVGIGVNVRQRPPDFAPEWASPPTCEASLKPHQPRGHLYPRDASNAGPVAPAHSVTGQVAAGEALARPAQTAREHPSANGSRSEP